jgi:hypothetical protein
MKTTLETFEENARLVFTDVTEILVEEIQLTTRYVENSVFETMGYMEMESAFEKIQNLSQRYSANLFHMNSCIRRRKISLGDCSSC